MIDSVRNTLGVVFLAQLVFVATAAAQTASYPTKPIRMLVPFAAGAATDIGARNLASRLAEVLGQPIVVENRPGAGGNVATRALIQAPTDGYTLLAGGNGQVSNVHLYTNAGYDYFRDLVPVASTTTAASLLVVNEKSPYRNARELIAGARTKADKLTFGSGGIGTSAHMAGSAFLKFAGAEGVHVPFKSAAEIVQAVLGGQIDFGVPILAVAHAQARAGRLRPIAVSTPQRHPMFPDVPTFTEVLPAPFALTTWFGIFVATGTPEPVVRQLHAAIVKVQRQPEFEQATVRDGSLVFMLDSPEAFAQFARKEFELYRTLVAQTGAKVD
jgi:tripartite-type tricarboxylate transporter receptor subunit TctC